MNYGPRNASILSRLDRHAAHAATAGLRKAAENCFAISQRFADDATEIAQDRRYSAEGKRAKLAEARAQKDALMRDARGPIDTAQKGVEALRAQIKPVVVDQSPVADAARRASGPTCATCRMIRSAWRPSSAPSAGAHG